MRTIAEYQAWLAEQDDPALLRAEALERMRVNVGLLMENTELKRQLREIGTMAEDARERLLEQAGIRDLRKEARR
jgi:hypothetical protein